MNQSLTLLALAMLLESLSPFKGLVVGSVLFWIILKKRINHLWILSIAILYLFRLFLEVPIPQLTEGRIVELNESSVLVMDRGIKALVTQVDPFTLSIGDQLYLNNCQKLESSPTLFGFNANDWAKALSISMRCDSAGLKHSSNRILRWLSGTDLDPDFQVIWRTLVLQSSQLSSLALIVSFGLVFHLILGGIQRILKHWLSDLVIVMVQMMIGLGFGIILGYPLALIRIIVQQVLRYFIQEPQNRWLWTIVCLGVFNPFGFTQLAWALPLSLAYLNSFKPVSRSWLSQALVVISVLMSHGLPIQVFQLFLLKKVRAMVPWILSLLVVSRWYGSLQRIWIALVSKMEEQTINFGWIHSKLSLLSFGILITVLSGIWLISDRKRIMIWISILFILNPLSLIPWVSQLTFINVGQGDSILVQSAFNQEVYLVDTGSSFAWDHLDSVLSGLGIKSLDGLILTHADADHSANQDEVLEHYPTHEVILEGKDLPFSSGILHYIPLEGMMNPNDASLIYRLTIFDVDVCLMADVSTFTEAQLIKNVPNLQCSILKVGHHGSKTSSSLRFLQSVNPHIAVVSVGKNTYGHPSFEVLKRLESLKIETILTQFEGDLQFYISPWFTLIRSAPFSFRFYLS